MFFRRLATKEATLSYLFGCGSCHVAVAVDPVLGDEDWFLTEAAEQNVKITHVIDTHVHADITPAAGVSQRRPAPLTTACSSASWRYPERLSSIRGTHPGAFVGRGSPASRARRSPSRSAGTRCSAWNAVPSSRP